MTITRRIFHVVGARPNFMKIAPVMAAIECFPDIEQRLVHTGQHYDEQMAQVFFRDLGLPKPDRDLEVGSGTQAEQTGAAMVRLERVLEEERPDLVVVVGDVNSTLAAAVVAAKAGVPLAHVEAGLRSRDWTMPEEINRIVTDRLASLLLTPSRDADENLKAEGVPPDRIRFVGNVMIDTLLRHRSKAPWPALRSRFRLEERRYALLTLHRPANVDDPAKLSTILERLAPLSKDYRILFPVHPRTARRLAESGLESKAAFLERFEPLGYLEFLGLMDHAAFVLTDSGGIQEETTVLGVPCFTLRDSTERPVTIAEGTNTLVGADARELAAAFEDFRKIGGKRGQTPELWDGHAGERVAAALMGFLRVS
ncbi:MAG: non-hydrolyzing UDP-N-acetylglucosamine 2-epimerase [Thermoanaerobaculia bacterium]